MPRATDLKYNLLASKPDDLDRYWLFDIDADEQKVQQYGVLKSFFVKTDEDTDVSANVEFQANFKLKFANAGEFQIYSDGIDLFVKGTNAAGKLRFYANSLEMLALDPVNDSIAVKTNAINRDGAAGEGMSFDSLNHPTILTIMELNAGISCNAQNISRTGLPGTGLEYDAFNNATFNQEVTINETLYCAYNAAYSLDVTNKSKFRGNLDIGLKYISNGGTNDGININAANEVTCHSGLVVSGGNINCTGGNTITGSGGVKSGAYLDAFSYCQIGSYLEMKENVSTPSSGTGHARIWVDGSKNVKIKHSDGTTQTFTLT